MASSYTLSGTIQNPNSFAVNYNIYVSAIDSSGSIIVTPYSLINTNIDASASVTISEVLSLTTSQATALDHFKISVYFSKSGYIDSNTVVINITKPGYPSGVHRNISQLGSSSPSDVTFSSSTLFDGYAFDEWTDDNGNVFIKFPTFYRKNVTVVDDQVTSFIISNSKEDDEFLPYPCFVRADGTIRDYIYVGKYNISSTSVANSVNATRVSMTVGNARTLCKAVGDGYYLMHVDVKLFLCDLALAISKTVNINTGRGVSADKFMGIQGDLYGWMDGLCRYTGNVYLYCHDPSKCVDSPTPSTSGYVQLSYGHPTTSSGYEISKLGYDKNYPFINLPSVQVSNSNYNTYYCDGFYFNTSSTSNPSYWDVGSSSALYGWWGLDVSYERSNTYSVRLCYMP